MSEQQPTATDPTQPAPAPAPAATTAPPADPTQPAPAPAPDPAALQSEVAQLRQQLADAEAQRQQAVQDALAQARGDRIGTPTDAVDLSGVDQPTRAQRYTGWPAEGGISLPQPWDLRRQGLQNAARDLIDQAPAGAPNTVAPVVITHNRPTLTSGSADQSVHELGRILAAAGFENSVSNGLNPYGVVDATVMAAVYAFRAAYAVEEDPSGFGGDTPAGRALAADHIGPWTWEAILRVGARQNKQAA